MQECIAKWARGVARQSADCDRQCGSRLRSGAHDVAVKVAMRKVVSGAGHEVPAYRPEAALKMLATFVLQTKTTNMSSK